MRRLVAVFSSKRDKSDSHHQPNRSHPSSAQSGKKHLKLPLSLGFTSTPPVRTPSSITSTPQLSSVSDHGQSSGSSSGSASVSSPNPEEDHQAASLTRNATRRSWKDWLGGKRLEPDPPKVPELPKSEGKGRARAGRVWDERPPTLQGPRVRGRVSKEVDDTDGESSEEFDDEDSVSVSDHARSSTTEPTPTTSPARAQQNLKSLIKNSLIPPLSTSPFIQHSPTYLFPRSCNRPQTLPPLIDTRRMMFRRRLLERLEKLSADDEKAILPLGSRSAPVSIKPPALPDHETSHPSNTILIFRASPGVRRWISRPCYEDRFSVFLPSEDGVRQTPVVGVLAVAALEYSEFLDVMVDPDFDPSSPPLELLQDVPWKPSLEDISSSKLPPPVIDVDKTITPAVNHRHSFILSPSPLRNQHNSEVPFSEPTLQSTITASLSVEPPLVSANPLRHDGEVPPQPTPISPLVQLPAAAPVKRVVRFVEDDAEDAVPLHLIRQKKKREEKAKFLRAEQRRRLMEREQERRKLEAEAIEQERRRLVREREKRDMEQRQYAEMVAATRARRESQRAGVIPGLKTDSNNNLLLPSPSTTSLRDMERNRPRDTRGTSLMPHHTGSSSSNPRREASDSGLSPHAYNFETSSYRTGSGGHSPGGSNSGHGYPSRPSSMYSSSSEDGRASGKRHSVISNNFARPFTDRTASYPMWSASNQSLQNVPPVPSIPPFSEVMNDFVLLPPSAPFMMQHSRQSRNSSPGRSNSSGSLRGNSTNSSSERINMYRQSSSRPKETYSAPPSPGTSPNQPTHIRQGSGDSRRSSMPTPASSHGSASHSHPSSLSRGRPQLPHSQTMQYMQIPNPWTALPTQRGTLPTAMPVTSYSHSMQLGSKTPFKGPVPGQSAKAKSGSKR